MNLYKLLGNYTFGLGRNKRRTYICKTCGVLERTLDYSRNADHPNKKHCGIALTPLTHEQSIAAYQLTPEKRVEWLQKGGYILKGNKKKRRWTPVFSDDDIYLAIKQEKGYSKKDQSFIDAKSDALFNNIIEEYLNLYPDQSDIDVEFKIGNDLEIEVKKALRLGYEKIFENNQFVDYFFHYIRNNLKPPGVRQCIESILNKAAGFGYPKLKDNPRFNDYWYKYIYLPNKNNELYWTFHFITPKAYYHFFLLNIWEEHLIIDWDYLNELSESNCDVKKIKNPCEFLRFVIDKDRINT